ncbi:MAG: GntR family transcriptional regulator [Longimicrobiales bacterium]
MRVTINTNDPRPIYVQIMDEVRRALVVGSLLADDPLPSVRELASELRVNPNTVAQAYRALERDNVVYGVRGKGTFVSAEAAPAAKHKDALAEGVAQRAHLDAVRHGITMEELIEALRAQPEGESPKAPTAAERNPRPKKRGNG